MKVITKKAHEVPNVNEESLKKSDVKEGMMEQISTTKEKIYDQFKGLSDMKVDVSGDNLPRVALSGKRNIKKLRNWMVKHMEAYPVTKYGFLVEFNGDTSNKQFVVRPCHEDEDPNITINGIDYMIIEKTSKIDPIDEIMKGQH